VKLYYEDDLSLGEIADKLGITRQAVYYTLKRALRRLKGIEGQLGLVERFLMYRRSFDGIIKELKSLRDSLSVDDRGKLERVIKKIDELIERGGLVV